MLFIHSVLVLVFTREGGSQADVNNRIRIGWIKWKEVSGVMCDRQAWR